MFLSRLSAVLYLLVEDSLSGVGEEIKFEVRLPLPLVRLVSSFGRRLVERNGRGLGRWENAKLELPKVLSPLQRGLVRKCERGMGCV